jgi:hypothetical protein
MIFRIEVPDDAFDKAGIEEREDGETVTTQSITFSYVEVKQEYPKVYYKVTIEKGVHEQPDEP